MKGDARHAIAGRRRRRREQLPDLGGELRRHALVGIERKDPVVAGLLGGEILLRDVAGPRPHDHLVGELPRNRDGVVGALAVDDDDLVGPREGLERGLDVRRFVEGDDGGRDRHGHQCYTSLSRYAADAVAEAGATAAGSGACWTAE